MAKSRQNDKETPPGASPGSSGCGPSELQLQRLSAHIAQLAPPEDFFAGLTLKSGLTPDNILFFKRTDTEAFRPDELSANTHHRFELLIVLKTAGPVHIGKTSHRLHPGEVALIFPHQFHHYMDVEAGAIEWLFITFELPDPSPLALAALRNSPRQLGADTLALLEEILRERLCPAPLPIAYHLSRFLLALLAAPTIPAERLNIYSTNSTNKTRDVVLEKISTYVHSHLSEPLALHTLAEALGYSESYLRAVFKNQLGLSLGRYIRESRLTEAAKRLQAGETNMGELAQSCGFESPFAFSRSFKNAYGVSPRNYSKRCLA